MKILKYRIYQSTNENGEDITIPKELPYTETNKETAKKEAYNGEYVVYNDDVEEVPAPTQQDKWEAQLMYTAMMMQKR